MTGRWSNAVIKRQGFKSSSHNYPQRDNRKYAYHEKINLSREIIII